MMKKSGFFRSATLSAVGAFTLAAILCACDDNQKTASAASSAPGVKSANAPAPLSAKAAPVNAKAAPAKPAAKTLDEVFVFLPDTLATVGDKKITKKEFLDQLGKIPVEYIAQLSPEMLRNQAKQMVSNLVDMEVLLVLAEKAGIKPTKELVIAEFDRKLKEMPKEQLDMITKQLELQGKKIDDLKNEAIKDPNTFKIYAINKWVEDNLKSKVKVSDADIEKYYKEHQDQYKKPETLTASHILISTMGADGKPADKVDPAKDKEAKAKAEKILADLKKGADFGALAEKESACPSGKSAKGKLPPFTKGQMVPEFEKAAAALKPGELSGVVKTSFGYHIIKLEAKTPAGVMPLADVKNQIKGQLEAQTLEKQLSDVLTKQKAEMKVTISDFK